MKGFGGFDSLLLFCLSSGSLRRSGSEAMLGSDSSSCSLCVVMQCGVEVVGVEEGVEVGSVGCFEVASSAATAWYGWYGWYLQAERGGGANSFTRRVCNRMNLARYQLSLE